MRRLAALPANFADSSGPTSARTTTPAESPLVSPTTTSLALARSADRIAQGGQERWRRLPPPPDAKRRRRRFIQNPRSARRDHSLISSRGAASRSDAAPVGLNAPPPTPSRNPLAPPCGRVAVRHYLTGRVAAGLIAVVGGLLLTPAAQAAGPPEIAAAWSTEVVATSAKLHAEINPEGTATTYHFDYITAAAYQANLAANPPREGFAGGAKVPAGADPGVGSGTALESVFQTLGALQPETAYRYRVVAHSPEGTETSAPHAFSTQSLGGATLLLDGRGWEMVSPAEKNGGQIGGFGQSLGGGVLQAAASGEAVTYSSTASFGQGAQGAPPASQYISSRGPSGWSTQNITTPILAGSYGDHPDGVPYQLFSGDLARGLLLDPSPCEGESCLRAYSLRDGESGTFTPSPEAPGLRFAGASPDLRHIVLSTCAALSAEATEVPSGGGGCEPSAPNLYRWSGGALTLVNLLPGEANGTPGAHLAAQGSAVSTDGSRIYFTDGEDSALYLREAGGPTKLVPETEGGAWSYETASADGSLAFFLKGAHLFRYSAVAQTATDLTPSGGVLGVLGASADGSRVYYATAAAVFLWQQGTPSTTTEVASSVEAVPAADPGDYPPTAGTARVTPDGAHLAFLSKARLTDYDNTDQRSGEPDSEVYLYSAAGGGGGGLICVSCNPTGERPLGPSTIPGAIANGKGQAATDAYKPRDLSANASRLFFDSRDALLLHDTDNAPDVYQWEAAGEGSCQAPGGCLGLISSGRSAEGASFLDASANGSDAFFLTDGSLVPSDPGSTDLYDARVGGGFPVAPTPIECQGDACQSLPPEPEDPAPATLLPGPPNPPVSFPKPGCPKGTHRVVRHGKSRCVPKHHGKRRGSK